MFIHFAPNTWQDREYDDLSTPLDKINPEKLDTDQWVRAAELMGARYIVFVVKHVGGFCMWRTNTTDYGIKDTAWRGGKGDVLGDLAASCKRRGMNSAYTSARRTSSTEPPSAASARHPRSRRPTAGSYREQLTEVLSRYGRMVEVWFDGSNVIEVGDILKKHAPTAMIFQGRYATIRWVGNEEGYAPDPAWNAVPESVWRECRATAEFGDPNGTVWLPNECDARIRANWFWNSKNAPTLKTVDPVDGDVLPLGGARRDPAAEPDAGYVRADSGGGRAARRGVFRRGATPIRQESGRNRRPGIERRTGVVQAARSRSFRHDGRHHPGRARAQVCDRRVRRRAMARGWPRGRRSATRRSIASRR